MQGLTYINIFMLNLHTHEIISDEYYVHILFLRILISVCSRDLRRTFLNVKRRKSVRLHKYGADDKITSVYVINIIGII